MCKIKREIHLRKGYFKNGFKKIFDKVKSSVVREMIMLCIL
jgi:hypothetical protein